MWACFGSYRARVVLGRLPWFPYSIFDRFRSSLSRLGSFGYNSVLSETTQRRPGSSVVRGRLRSSRFISLIIYLVVQGRLTLLKRPKMTRDNYMETSLQGEKLEGRIFRSAVTFVILLNSDQMKCHIKKHSCVLS